MDAKYNSIIPRVSYLRCIFRIFDLICSSIVISEIMLPILKRYIRFKKNIAYLYLTCIHINQFIGIEFKPLRQLQQSLTPQAYHNVL